MSSFSAEDIANLINHPEEAPNPRRAWLLRSLVIDRPVHLAYNATPHEGETLRKVAAWEIQELYTLEEGSEIEAWTRAALRPNPMRAEPPAKPRDKINGTAWLLLIFGFFVLQSATQRQFDWGSALGLFSWSGIPALIALGTAVAVFLTQNFLFREELKRRDDLTRDLLKHDTERQGMWLEEQRWRETRYQGPQDPHHGLGT